MASHSEPRIETFKADAALAKGKAVKFGSDNEHVAVGAANSDLCFGLVQSVSLAAEDVVEVAISGGGAKGLLGETVLAGQPLVSHTDGSLVLPNALGDKIVAWAMEGGLAGDLVGVEVAPSLAVAAV